MGADLSRPLTVDLSLSRKKETVHLDPDYADYVTEGYVSVVGSDKKVPVRILRHWGVLNIGIRVAIFHRDRDRRVPVGE